MDPITYENSSPINPEVQAPDQTLHTIQDSEFTFFFSPCNDFQIYHITCKEIPVSLELVSQLLNNIDDNNTSDLQSNLFVFHFQHENKIYQATCSMISHTYVIDLLNKEFYGLEFDLSEQQQQEFSKDHRINLKYHLKQFLCYNLNEDIIQDNFHDQTISSNSLTVPINDTNNTPVAPIDIDSTMVLSRPQQYIGYNDNTTFGPYSNLQQDNYNQFFDFQNCSENYVQNYENNPCSLNMFSD